MEEKPRPAPRPPAAPAPAAEKTFRPLVVIPVYNHPSTVGAVVADIRTKHRLPVLLVDDGSNEETRAACSALASVAVTVLHHEVNQGKGAALETAFRWAKKAGYTHVLQIDADGQHDRAAVGRFVALSQKFPHALICGYPVYDKSVPLGRLWGRKLTNFWVAVNGLSLSFEDAMCGMRVYPLDPVCAIIGNAHVGKRMEFDPEILVRLLWAGVRVKNVPVAVTYPVDGVSHFRVLRDNMLISLMHAKLCVMMLTRLPIILWSRIFGWAPEREVSVSAARSPRPAKSMRPKPAVRAAAASERPEGAEKAELEERAERAERARRAVIDADRAARAARERLVDGR